MSSLAADTSDEVQALLDERWLKMSPAAKADVVTALCDDCTALALAGIAAQYGEIDAEETAFHLAARRYGPALARRAYHR